MENMDIQVKEFQAPKIVINYETLKAELTKLLEEYKGLVVTEQTLAGGKAAQKELASLRVKIDTYRKDKKKELEQPIKQFEAQCKELIALVESVEKPIKEGIKVYDDKKREEKRQTALTLIEEVAAATGLNEKYTAKLDVLDKYMNLTATVSGVRDDLETRAFALKVEQDREQERLDIIKSVLESENSRLKTPMQLTLWQRDIDYNVPTSEIIESIKKHATLVYEAENKPTEPPKQEEATEVPPHEEKQPETPQEQLTKQYTATYKIFGTVEELRAVSAYLRERGISYEVLDQREV
jgi:hypothetical protein